MPKPKDSNIFLINFNTCAGFKEVSMATKQALPALLECVYNYIRQLSSFRALTLLFIDLTVQHTFLILCQFILQENGQNMKSPPFLYDTKMATNGY